jgi:aspartate aminotransferase
MHRYMPNAGYPETRQAVADGLYRETGIRFTLDEIVMTCGAAAALNVVLKAILNPGDQVVFPSPFFVEYGYYVDNHGGEPVPAPTDASFLPDISLLDEAITSRTRALLINSPNNPTGVVYSADVIRAIGELLYEKQRQYNTEIFLISDEPYRRIIYDGLAYPQVFPHYINSIAVHSHAKDLALPGERIGYIAVNPEYPEKVRLLEGLTFANRILGFVNAPALMQHVVRPLQGVSVDIADYQRKRNYLYRQLVGMGYQVVKPQGAFYLFPKSPIDDDTAFVEELQRNLVLTVPGRGFGAPGHFRISYCTEDRVLDGAMDAFDKAIRKF